MADLHFHLFGMAPGLSRSLRNVAGRSMGSLESDLVDIVRPVDPRTGEPLPMATINVEMSDSAMLKILLALVVAANSPFILKSLSNAVKKK